MKRLHKINVHVVHSITARFGIVVRVSASQSGGCSKFDHVSGHVIALNMILLVSPVEAEG